jgi:hypothetical protein
MKSRPFGILSVSLVLFALIIASVFFLLSDPLASAANSQPETEGSIATEAQLRLAHEAWSRSKHADTYDDGLGANTTCARCKSPTNWDPTQDVAQQQALDCGACKRVPGAPRPELSSGILVPEDEWGNITCEICHIPAGDSYYTDIAYLNQATGQYDEVDKVEALCAHCHEGRHGFHVIEEMAETPIHSGMTCTDCHGSHGGPSSCDDCHNPESGSGAPEHTRHSGVNCTGCHDGGRLSIWKETNPSSAHFGDYIPVRFAHTLTSWPSHNLTTEIECERCHHPRGHRESTLVPGVSCDECHDHPFGAVSNWCTFFPRDPDPNDSDFIEP